MAARVSKNDKKEARAVHEMDTSSSTKNNSFLPVKSNLPPQNRPVRPPQPPSPSPSNWKSPSCTMRTKS